jgi:hypothetical protein
MYKITLLLLLIVILIIGTNRSLSQYDNTTDVQLQNKKPGELSEEQPAYQPKDRFGVNLILTAAKQNISGILEYYEGYENFKFDSEYLHGLGIGVFYETYFNSSVSLSLNLEYIQRGTETYILIPNAIEGYIDKGKVYNKIDYLSFPVCIKLILLKNEIQPHFLFGFRMDYAFSYDSDYLKYYYKDMENIVFGFVTGLGCEVKITEYLTLLPKIRYNVDFDNIIYKNNLKFRNSSFDFSMGVKIK